MPPPATAWGQEDLARATFDEVLARVREAPSSASAPSHVLTVRAYAEAWLSKRKTETAADDRGRIYNHILPALGNIPDRRATAPSGANLRGRADKEATAGQPPQGWLTGSD
jgi:hypothetical protein